MSFSIYRNLFIGLLFLVSLSFVLNQPGSSNLELFHQKFDRQRDKLEPPLVFRSYPPTLYFFLENTLKGVPREIKSPDFYQSMQFLFFKIVLFLAYLAAWLSVYLYSRTNTKHTNRTFFKSVSILFLISFPITLSSLGLTYYDIFAVPFIIVTITLLKKGKHSLSAIFYLFAISLNWSLLLLGPICWFFINKLSRFRSSAFSTFAYLFLPVLVFLSIVITFLRDYLNKSPLLEITTGVFGLPWLTIQFNSFASGTSFVGPLGFSVNPLNVLPLVIIPVLLAVFLAFIFSQILWPHTNKAKMITLTIGISFVFLLLFTAYSLNVAFSIFFHSVIFLYVYFSLLFLYLKRKVDLFSFLKVCFLSYFSFLVLFPYTSDGNVVWLVIFNLLLLLEKPSPQLTKLFLAVNLIVFLNLFFFHGINGYALIKGEYAKFFGYLFSGFSLLFFSVLFSSNVKHEQLTKYH